MPKFKINFAIIVLLNICATCVYANNRENLFQSTLGHIKPSATDEEQTEAVQELIKRIIPNKAHLFVVNVSNNIDDFVNKDGFKLENSNGTIKITANTGVAAATGFHYYLKYFCQAHISWEASQLNLTDPLPDVKNVTITLNDRFRYYQNVCTQSYSFVWWDWAQWEKHIDWIVLNSFNFVLSFHGQEAIWERVYKKLNLTENDINEHFSGPAFLSWLRMGNLRGWGGPLSQSWHERSLVLQKLVLQRLKSFGVITILPAFAGHLPVAFKRLYPDANMTRMDRWNSFNDTYCCPYFLDPTEELFQQIGTLFMEEQIAEFGTDHVYNCDSFNEVDPSSTDLDYLSNVGKAIYNSMTNVDPDAIWVMQGWLFYYSSFWNNIDRAEAFVTSVPLGKMIILDLQSEQFPQYTRLDQYFGQPYIWCMLHNFGGTLGMFGSARIINERVIEARNEANSTMIGTGLTMEGINQNYVIYDLMTEMAWRDVPSNLDLWFANYTVRRYGKTNTYVIGAWQILKNSIYQFETLERMRGQYAITRTPSLGITTWTWYNYTDLFSAFDLYLNAAENFENNPAYLHDLVDITRQVLQVNGDIYYEKIKSSFRSRNRLQFREVTEIFEQIFEDMESILSTNEAFLLGTWLESAKNCGNKSDDEKLFEYNARNQITLWGPNGEIMNYANKQWSGIVSDFFYARWKVFLTALNESIEQGVPLNQTKVKQDMFNIVEEPFTFSQSIYPTEPSGDAISVAKEIRNKYLGNQHKNIIANNKYRRSSFLKQTTPQVVVVD